MSLVVLQRLDIKQDIMINKIAIGTIYIEESAYHLGSFVNLVLISWNRKWNEHVFVKYDWPSPLANGCVFYFLLIVRTREAHQTYETGILLWSSSIWQPGNNRDILKSAMIESVHKTPTMRNVTYSTCCTVNVSMSSAYISTPAHIYKERSTEPLASNTGLYCPNIYLTTVYTTEGCDNTGWTHGNMDKKHGYNTWHWITPPMIHMYPVHFMPEIKYWLKTLITLVHHPQKVYERFWLPRIRPLRCDYFNKSQSENPCIKISQLSFVFFCLVLLV